jgi:hypothetical protein
MKVFAEKPKTLAVGGVRVPVDTDFRLMCEYAQAINAKDTEEVTEIASRFFYAGVPEGVSGTDMALAMNDFYVSGFVSDEEERERARKKAQQSAELTEEQRALLGKKESVPVFDFAVDEAYFFGAFLSVYGIDLNTAKLHWLDFCALFRALPDECRLKQIIGIRATDTAKIRSKEERERIRRLKKLYSLNGTQKDPLGDALREMILKEKTKDE